jgi:hypothetical protein
VAIPPTQGAPQTAALAKLRDIIPRSGKIVEIGQPQEADFFVVINNRDEFEIQDPSGVAIPKINPQLKISDEFAAGKVLGADPSFKIQERPYAG